MQQTSIDYFLKDRFVFSYHIRVNRIPRRIPWGVKAAPAPRTMKHSWSFILRCDSMEIYNATVAYLRSERMMYDPTIAERDTILARICNPPNQESITYNTLWTTARLAIGFMTLNLGMRIIPTLNSGSMLTWAGHSLTTVE